MDSDEIIHAVLTTAVTIGLLAGLVYSALDDTPTTPYQRGDTITSVQAPAITIIVE